MTSVDAEAVRHIIGGLVVAGHRCRGRPGEVVVHYMSPLFDWIRDLEDALWNAGLEDRQFLTARIAVCEEGLRRFLRKMI
jgi:hypothetical protein